MHGLFYAIHVILSAGSVLFFEVFLAYAAERTLPIIGKVCEKGSGLDSVIGIADFFVLDVAANCANEFSHSTILLFLPFLYQKAVIINGFSSM